jgi:hypothetical protein
MNLFDWRWKKIKITVGATRWVTLFPIASSLEKNFEAIPQLELLPQAIA